MDTRSDLILKFPYSRLRGSVKSSVLARLAKAVDDYYGENLRLKEAFLSRAHLFSAHTPWSYFKNHRAFESPREAATRAVVELQLDGYFYCEGFFATEHFGSHHSWVCDDKGKGFELYHPDSVWRPGSLMVGVALSAETLHHIYAQGKQDFGILHAEASSVLGLRALTMSLAATKQIQLNPFSLAEEGDRSVTPFELTA